PPMVARIVRVERMDQQDAVTRIEQEDASANARRDDVGGNEHPAAVPSRLSGRVFPAADREEGPCGWSTVGSSPAWVGAVAGSDVSSGVIAVRASCTASREWSVRRVPSGPEFRVS